MARKGRRTDKIGSAGPKKHPGFPGKRTLDMVDLILFLADARIPWTSARLAEPYLGGKNRVYVLTKPDLADEEKTKAWQQFLSQGGHAFTLNARSGQGVNKLLNHLKSQWNTLCAPDRGAVERRPLRIMLFGAPNVGKSSLGNRLLGSRKAPFGARPGLTRGSHWLRGRGFLMVLDTPGVLDASLVKGVAKMKLAAAWALRENAYDAQEVALWLAGKISEKSAPATLEEFGRSRGLLSPGGEIDMTAACQAYVRAFQEGSLGPLSLEDPHEIFDIGQTGHSESVPGES